MPKRSQILDEYVSWIKTRAQDAANHEFAARLSMPNIDDDEKTRAYGKGTEFRPPQVRLADVEGKIAVDGDKYAITWDYDTLQAYLRSKLGRLYDVVPSLSGTRRDRPKRLAHPVWPESANFAYNVRIDIDVNVLRENLRSEWAGYGEHLDDGIFDDAILAITYQTNVPGARLPRILSIQPDEPERLLWYARLNAPSRSLRAVQDLSTL